MSFGLFSNKNKRQDDNQSDSSFLKEAEDALVVNVNYQVNDNDSNNSAGYNFAPFITQLIELLKNGGGEIILRLVNDENCPTYYFGVGNDHIVTVPIQLPSRDEAVEQEPVPLYRPLFERLKSEILERLALPDHEISIVNAGFDRRSTSAVVGSGALNQAYRYAKDFAQARQMCGVSQNNHAPAPEPERDLPRPTWMKPF